MFIKNGTSATKATKRFEYLKERKYDDLEKKRQAFQKGYGDKKESIKQY